MPIFQDDLDHPDFRPLIVEPPSTSSLRRFSDESLRTDLCEGPVPDSLPDVPGQKKNPDHDSPTSDRQALIEKLKRGESPTWIPSRHSDEPVFDHTDDYHRDHENGHNQGHEPPHAASPTPSESSSVRAAADLRSKKDQARELAQQRLNEGLSIERPRSALHTGDFTSAPSTDPEHHGYRPMHPSSPTRSSFMVTSPPRDFTPFRRAPPRSDLSRSLLGSLPYGTPPPLPSPSLSSSLAYQPPTSPLAQSETNDDVTDMLPIDYFNGGIRHYHRSPPMHTPPPVWSFSNPSSLSSQQSRHRRMGSLPSQAHQPMRSLQSTPGSLQSGSSPISSWQRSRRQSLGSDVTPIQHASMVGSYEESILRGRMSTTPSKPLEFMAQIGVLGMGECSARLKCPPHVTLPFAAVYYSYGSTSHGRSQSDDGPSPYVGQVDLENGLPNQEGEGRSRRKAQSRYRAAEDQNNGEPKNATREATPRNSSSRSSGGPRAPPGGSYRIPAKGQLQIIIKNQNKTAVKLFLVPYDLAGMEPGTKTFMRQRCYSAGPILDGIPRTSAAAAAADEKPTLRYLIHLHICCPSRGRYYLYKSIRVVFANRVPDGKERLRNEMTMPDPRYTPYKPVRVMQPLATPSAVSGAALAADKALRRRSAGFPPYTPSRPSAGLESSALAPHSTDRRYFSSAAGAAPSDYHHTLLVADPILLHLPTSKRNGSVASGDDSPSTSRPSTVDSSTVPDLGGAGNLDGYAKLSRGDAGYGGLPFTQLSTDAAASEGLLTQRLRSIGVAGDSPPRDAAHPSI